MHIVVTDQTTGKPLGTLCVDRNTNTCTVLHCTPEHINTLVGIATGMKMKQMLVTVSEVEAQEYINAGWQASDELIVLVKA